MKFPAAIFDLDGTLLDTLADIADSMNATLEKIGNATELSKDQLVLPMALLMKTDRLHFKQSGDRDIYVSKGKAPDKPATPQPRRKKTVKPRTEEKKPEKKKRFSRKREKDDDDDIEPTASVLVFGRRKK